MIKQGRACQMFFWLHFMSLALTLTTVLAKGMITGQTWNENTRGFKLMYCTLNSQAYFMPCGCHAFNSRWHGQVLSKSHILVWHCAEAVHYLHRFHQTLRNTWSKSAISHSKVFVRNMLGMSCGKYQSNMLPNKWNRLTFWLKAMTPKLKVKPCHWLIKYEHSN